MSAYPSSGQDRRVAAEPLRRLVSEVFGRCGMSAKDAALLIGGVERIYVPGETEGETEEEPRREGIPLSAATLEELRTAAEQVGAAPLDDD